eukprot:3336932-Prymnesium_polylepis.1
MAGKSGHVKSVRDGGEAVNKLFFDVWLEICKGQISLRQHKGQENLTLCAPPPPFPTAAPCTHTSAPTRAKAPFSSAATRSKPSFVGCNPNQHPSVRYGSHEGRPPSPRLEPLPPTFFRHGPFRSPAPPSERWRASPTACVASRPQRPEGRRLGAGRACAAG